ncbi:flagellin [Rhizobium leguminosarum]|uniref:flagellin n=1 Tax=Rhizobium leguminosarum TaxID=384 RepID=UPI003F97846A
MNGVNGSVGFELFNFATVGTALAGYTDAVDDTNIVRGIEQQINRFSADRQAAWGDAIQNFDVYLQGPVDRMATLGSLQKSTAISDELVNDRLDTMGKGIGRLVDSDMNEESARLRALETQGQLGRSALSIANGSADNILKLYQ